MGRPWSWITGQPRLIDGVLVAVTLVPGIVAPVADAYFGKPIPLVVLSALLVPVQSLPLIWRRSHPVAVLLVVTSAPLVRVLLGLSLNASTGAVVFAVYAVSVYGGPRIRIRVGIAVIAMIAVGIALTIAGVIGGRQSDLFSVGPISLVAWVVGDFVRSRRQAAAEAARRQDEQRRAAVEDERLRIARELHDVVAHKVSVIAIQAGAARIAGNQADGTLKSIEEGARETLSELNKLLGVLRKSPTAPELAPQPSLEQVDALLKPARDAGLEATLRVIGDKRTLPAALELSGYRIVQEGITNVLKHAGATRLEVSIDYLPDLLAVTISDNGTGPRPTTSNGHGLLGMRERAALFGGHVSTGSSSLGGFTVRATLPVKT